MKTKKPMLATAAATLIALAAVCADASSLSIHPTRVHLTGAEAKAIAIRNRNPYEILVQSQVHGWSQTADGHDVLTDSDDILVSPPIIRVPAHSEKVVRVATRSPVESESEATFRLVFSEVLQNAPVEGAPGVRFAIQFDIPVFANQKEASAPKLSWSIADQPGGDWEVRAANIGASHVQVRSIAVRCKGENAADVLVGTSTRPAYLLPGARRSWAVSPREFSCARRDEEPSTAVVAHVAPVLNWSPDLALTGTVGELSEELTVVESDERSTEVDLSVLRIHAKTDRGDLEERIAVRVRRSKPIIAGLSIQ